MSRRWPAWLLSFAAALGMSGDDLEACEPLPEAHSYCAFVAWLAIYGSDAELAGGFLVNFAAWGANRAKDWYRRLRQNEVQLVAGNKQAAEGVGQGQFPISLTDTVCPGHRRTTEVAPHTISWSTWRRIR